NTTRSPSSRRRKYVSCAADKGGREAVDSFAVLETAHLLGRQRDMMRPVSMQVGAGDFALAPRHRRLAYRRRTSILNSSAAFTIAVASSGASTEPSQTDFDAILNISQRMGAGGSGFFAMPAVWGGR